MSEQRIVNIRGANGAGKSTLVKKILGMLVDQTAVDAPGRKRPIAYTGKNRDGCPIAILGAYETPTGGCDTIGDIETIFMLVDMYAQKGMHVLFEGIVAQHSATRLLEINAKWPVDVIVLRTTQDDCVASVRARRAARGATVEEFDPKNVIKEFKSVVSSTKRLKGDGVRIHELDRDVAFEWTKSFLGLWECDRCRDIGREPDDYVECRDCEARRHRETA